MNILIMDGIPHDHPYAPYSETMAKRIMKEDHHTIEFFQLSKMNLKYCTGCWSCWYKTPGLCPIKDDQSTAHQQNPPCRSPYLHISGDPWL